MAQEIVEVARLLTIHLPSGTKLELWDYAYYAHLCTLSREAEQAYKRYLEDGEHHPSFHNLAVLYTNAGRYDEALSTIEQALRLEPKDEGSLQQKTLIERKIEQKKQEEQLGKEQAEKQQRQFENVIRTAPER